tara:strand:+ start:133 stop:321 length:189 start_codon:yes stop_codon:yes gene_type:complete
LLGDTLLGVDFSTLGVVEYSGVSFLDYFTSVFTGEFAALEFIKVELSTIDFAYELFLFYYDI